uniref:Germacrene D synthase n=1 Tax=Taiwania cryptomerioides TaxID=50187 RepID=A0A6C0TJK8_TAICR|nr:germacrene D synthase [Taiwania cryptomerioides]
MTSLKGDDSSSIPDRSFNQWDDNFVQSLETPYGAAEYCERVKTLVKEVKILLNEMQSGDGNVMERLEMIDALQCLGIDRYFGTEIKAILDCVYRYWDRSVGIDLGCDSSMKNLNATALGLRVLRLYCYDVSADVLENFKDKNGQFLFLVGTNDNNQNIIREEQLMRIMLNLLRASGVAFPEERIMEEAKVFSSIYLKQILQKPEDMFKKSFLKEVEYALLYEWSRTFSRWEARNFIEIYKLDNLRLKDKKILELAKLDFNVLQFAYKMEMKNLSSWWAGSRLTNLIPIRQRPIEYFLLGVSAGDKLEFSSSRIALAKSTTLLSLMDDLFDDYLTLQQVELVTKAIIQGWDISIIEDIPANFKRTVEFVFQEVHELAREATKKQGREMMPFITKAWADYVEASLKQAQWNARQHIPTYNEYIKIAATTAAIGPLSLHPLLLAAHDLVDDAIEKIFNNQCRFYELIWLCTRLIDDVHDYQDDKQHGQITSAISCYMGDHPECSEEEALNHINYIISQSIKELTWEFLKQDNALLDWEKLSFNLNRGLQCFYVFGYGFSYHDKGMKQRIIEVLIDPIQI